MTGYELRNAIRAANMTQREFAAKAGYAEEWISKLIGRGDKDIPERTAIVLRVKLEAQEAS